MSIHVRMGIANASESERVRVTVDVVSVRKHRGQICKLNDHTSENTNTGTRRT